VSEQLRMFHANESEEILVSYACLVLIFGQQILNFGLVEEFFNKPEVQDLLAKYSLSLIA
jgi:hypothetical protein